MPHKDRLSALQEAVAAAVADLAHANPGSTAEDVHDRLKVALQKSEGAVFCRICADRTVTGLGLCARCKPFYEGSS